VTPDLLDEFAIAMEDLEGVADALEEHGPAYLRRCMEAGRMRIAPSRPTELPPAIAKAIREIADDALVRVAARPRPLTHRPRSAAA
jgi:hypothetical protein